MEQAYCTAVFWRGGEKIDLNGLKPDAVRCLSVTGERKVNLSFLRDYPNLEELTLMEKCEGVEVLSELKQLHTLSLWLSAPVSWDNVSLPGLRVLHLRGEKNGDITPLLSSITNLHLEEMRKTEDLTPFLTPATRLQKLYLQSLPAVQKLPALDGLPSLYALKLYELHMDKLRRQGSECGHQSCQCEREYYPQRIRRFAFRWNWSGLGVQFQKAQARGV